jgi:hypothetical protein
MTSVRRPAQDYFERLRAIFWLRRLKIQHFAVMNVNGWKEDLVRVACLELEGHRMWPAFEFLQLEHDKTVVIVDGQLGPSFRSDREARIESPKILNLRHDGRDKLSNFLNF